MTQYVTGPNGTTHEFPDDATPEVINAQMSAAYPHIKNGAMRPAPAAPGLQQAGDKTVATGQPFMPNMQTVPERIGNDDWSTLAMSMLFPKAAEVLSKTPGKVYQNKIATDTADALAKVEAKQRAGAQILKAFGVLEGSYDNLTPEQHKAAFGPRNTAQLEETSPTFVPYTNLPIPGLSGPTTVDPKTKQPIAGKMTPVQQAAILRPNDPAAQEAWQHQLAIMHNLKAVNAAAMQLNTGPNSDSRTALLGDILDQFVRAPDQKGGKEILGYAKHLLATDYNIPPDVADKIIGAARAEHAQKEAHQNMLKAAANVPPDAYKKLLDNAMQNNGVATPDYIKGFNDIFNGGQPGLAEGWLAAQRRARPAQPVQ